MEYDYGVSKRITETKGAIVVSILFIVFSFFLLISTFSKDVNISSEYSLYCELKNINSSATLLQTLKDEGITYHIEDEKIILDDYSYVSFKITDTGCTIVPNEAMIACTSIKNSSSTKIQYKERTIKGEKTTIAYLQGDNGINYVYDKHNGYYITNTDLTTILGRLALICVIIGMIVIIVIQYKNYKNLTKQPEKKTTNKIQYIIGGEK